MRRCALGLALLSLARRVGAQQSDEERIAELEEELEALREAARGRLSCTAEGGFVSIAPIEDAGGDVTGYTITNVTAADDAGLTVLEVALSDQDTDVVLPGMVVRISRASGGSSEAELLAVFSGARSIPLPHPTCMTCASNLDAPGVHEGTTGAAASSGLRLG